MKYIFHFKLYVEGLKKIRLVGIIAGIIVLIGNALPPVTSLLERTEGDGTVTILTASDFAIPTPFLLFLTPFFFLSMYSFLNKRNESDFYHAVPFKRSCVLLTFLASIYTWIWGLLLISLLLTGLLWALCPGVSFAVSVIPQLFGVYAAASLYIGSFVLLAMTLTGTVISNIAVSGILLFFVRLVGSIVTVILDCLVPILDLAYSPMRILSMRYYLPAAVLTSFYDASIFKSVGLWVYSFAVLAVLYALAIFCYCRRKSESANKSTPNRGLQHVFRCAFTLPVVLLAAYAWIREEGTSFIVFLLVFAVVAYFLYELITTKSLHSTLRAAPMVVIPFLCSGLIIGGCFLTRNAVLNTTYEADEIRTVRIYSYSSLFDLFMRGSDSYEALATEGVRISDREAAQLVAEALEKSIQKAKGDDPYRWDHNTRGANVEITLRSGKRIGRYLTFTEEKYRELQKAIQSSEEFRKAYIRLPETKYIQRIHATLCYDVSQDDLMRLWETFAKEYGALSEEEKVTFKNKYRRTINNQREDIYVEGEDGESGGPLTGELFLNVRGAVGPDTFESIYFIPESFTQTRALYFELCAPERDRVRDELASFSKGGYDKKLAEEDAYLQLNIYIHIIRNGIENASIYSVTNGETQTAAYKEQKALIRNLLPCLTDVPEEEDYIRLEIEVNGYDKDHNSCTTHLVTFFGYTELPEELIEKTP
ncbi:MAG: hypothetical protein J1E00_03800 [Oscillospiraceae bacterium]|nr:hypothetical protein [Oscillospiraceae bacterium]